MNRRGKTKVFWMLLVLLAICLRIPRMRATAEESGSIRLELPAKAHQVEMTLYPVGTMSGTNFQCSGPFAGSGIVIPSLENANALEQAASDLAAYAKEHAIAGTAKAGNDAGVFYYDGLAPALYLLVQTGGADVLEVQSLLLPIPYLSDSLGNVSYQVEAKPKYSVPEHPAKLTVRKRLTDISGNEVRAEAETFYVALFDSPERTNRVTDVKPIVFKDSGTSSVTFEGLKSGQKYYVGETDPAGTLIDRLEIGGSVCTPSYPDGYEVMPSEKEPAQEFSFENVFLQFPPGYYYPYNLTLTKRVKKDGKPFNSNETYYAGVFADPDYRELAAEVVRLDMSGGSETSVTIELFGEADENAARTFYITETDADGTPLENGHGLSFRISQDKESVTLDRTHPEDAVVITNSFEENPDKPSPGGNTDTSRGVKTGDETPVGRMLALLLAAAAVFAGVLFYGRKKRGEEH